MQILILGNGFDLACGLETRYEDFFNWRMEKIKDIVAVQNKEYYKLFMKGPNRYHEKINSAIRGYTIIEKDAMHSFGDVYKNAVNDIINILNSNVNFFDFYFYINNIRSGNWSNIETEIAKIVKKVQNYTISSEVKAISYLREKYNTRMSQLSNTLNDELYDLLLTIFFEKCCISRKLNYFEILMVELKKFEREFKEYINEQIDNINESKYISKYFKNLHKLINQEFTYIINFNYTSFENLNMNSNKLFIENNVHGKHDKVTIFGIDQTGCDFICDDYIFTKTFRKIEEKTDIRSLPHNKEKLSEKQSIIFYGHSLAKADYSYFQSLFDLYDIYNQTYLVFKYSVFNKEDEYLIKKNAYSNAMKLLKEYGKTMSNKDHGQNLIHKILLEGRLIIEEEILERLK